MTDESNIGVWLWVVLLVEINLSWILMDLWLKAHGHEFLTTEFKEGLSGTITGPILVGATSATVGAFVWHMWSNR